VVKVSWRRAIRVVAAAVAAAAAISGCSYPSSGEHPALVICGAALEDAGGGPEAAADHLTRADRTITYISGYQTPLYFSVAPGCAHGSHVTWIPRSAAKLVRAAYASDGLAVAIVLQPSGPRATFRLIVTRDGRLVASVIVEPQPPASPEIAATASSSTS
jgi:hypothetical protein